MMHQHRYRYSNCKGTCIAPARQGHAAAQAYAHGLTVVCNWSSLRPSNRSSYGLNPSKSLPPTPKPSRYSYLPQTATPPANSSWFPTWFPTWYPCRDIPRITGIQHHSPAHPPALLWRRTLHCTVLHWPCYSPQPAEDPQELRRTVHRAYCEGPVFLTPPADPQQQQQELEQQQQEGTSPPEHRQPGTSHAPAPPDTPTTAAPAPAAPSAPEPYVRVVFIGTGFLMHQIRRMVGLALAVARRAAPPECIRAALDPGRRGLAVPTAPPNGLMMVRGNPWANPCTHVGGRAGSVILFGLRHAVWPSGAEVTQLCNRHVPDYVNVEN